MAGGPGPGVTVSIELEKLVQNLVYTLASSVNKVRACRGGVWAGVILPTFL